MKLKTTLQTELFQPLKKPHFAVLFLISLWTTMKSSTPWTSPIFGPGPAAGKVVSKPVSIAPGLRYP